VSGALAGGRSLDWFFYVNGIESPIGSADRAVKGGDRIWWDYHDWTDVMRVPAVVGSFPEPLAQESVEGGQEPVEIACLGANAPCRSARSSLTAAGIDADVAAGAGTDDGGYRVVVGPWARVRRDGAAGTIARGPATSGVFADFAESGGGWKLEGLDERAEAVAAFSSHAGLIAAVRPGEDRPTWVVTGTDGAGVRLAAKRLDGPTLRGRFAVALTKKDVEPLPVDSARDGGEG
jgi:hypothetical protein